MLNVNVHFSRSYISIGQTVKCVLKVTQRTLVLWYYTQNCCTVQFHLLAANIYIYFSRFYIFRSTTNSITTLASHYSPRKISGLASVNYIPSKLSTYSDSLERHAVGQPLDRFSSNNIWHTKMTVIDSPINFDCGMNELSIKKQTKLNTWPI